MATVGAGHEDYPGERKVNLGRDEVNCVDRFNDHLDNTERGSKHKHGRLCGEKAEHR